MSTRHNPPPADRLHLDRLAQRALQEIGLAGDQLVEVERLRIEHLAPGKGEQPLGQRGGPLGAAPGAVDRAPQAGHRAPLYRVDIVARDLQIAEDDGQQIVEVMRHAAGQLPDRFQLAGLQQLLAGAVEQLLCLALGGNIAGDLGKAD